MDLTPRLLTEVEFREQWRGYSPSDVDDFLERVALALGELQERLREVTERAAQAERRLLDRSDDDDEIRRTLLLAQRTAATTVEEAQAQAASILTEAEEAASGHLAEGEARRASLDAELAEREASELRDLAERRATVERETDALATFAESHRRAVRAELTRLLAELDDPSPALVQPEPPAFTSRPEVPAMPELPVIVVPSTVPPAFSADPLPPRPPTDAEVGQAREDLVAALRRAGVEDFLAADPAQVLEPDPEPEPDSLVIEHAQRVYDADVDLPGEPAPTPVVGEPTSGFDVLAAVDDDGGEELRWGDEPAMAEPEPRGPSAGDDDPFLAELRRAVTDTDPLGPRDDDDHYSGDDSGNDPAPPGRFRLRRGR